MIWGDRDWKDEESLKVFRETSAIILDYFLAIEDYEDRNGVRLEDFIQLNKQWKQEKEQHQNKTDKEMSDISKNILEKYKKLVEKIGKEKFIIYDDGTIEYKVR